MSRYTGPTTRINRRFKHVIFAPTKASERKPYLPGMHGPRLRRKLSDYSIGLTEKQKLRYLFGLTEKQFSLTFKKAKRLRGITGENFLRLLEMRLDNTIYRLGLAKSRPAARQFVNHRHTRVNGKKVDIPSFSVSVGDVIDIPDTSSSKQLATQALEDSRLHTRPSWLSLEADTLRGEVLKNPDLEEMEQGINLQIIVEFYSR